MKKTEVWNANGRLEVEDGTEELVTKLDGRRRDKLLRSNTHALYVLPGTGHFGEPHKIGTDIAGMRIGYFDNGNLIVDRGQDFVVVRVDE